MNAFTHDGFDLAYIDHGEGPPVLLIHGFASTAFVNWVSPGWIKTLTGAGFRAIAFDHRGHGASTKSYDPAAYVPAAMAGDAAALLDHLGLERAHVMGYSMGARVAAFLALQEPARVATLVFGGLGIGMVDGVGDWDPIADALVALGGKDDIGGSAEELATLMPNAESFVIEGRDHMLSVGDRTFKKRVLEFLAAHPL